MQQYTHGAENASHRRPLNRDRRTSNHRPPEDRYGTVGDIMPDADVRMTTPELQSSSSTDLTALPSPSPLLQKNYSRAQGRDNDVSVSNTDEEGTIANVRRRIRKKSRTIDSSDLPRTSPASSNSIFRKRKDKAVITNPVVVQSTTSGEDSATSIGFPSVMQSASIRESKKSRQNVPKLAGMRTTSTESTKSEVPGSPISVLPPEPDSAKLDQLMKALCGRMHGVLFYRAIGSPIWNSGYCSINKAPGNLTCGVQGDIQRQRVLISNLRGCTVRTQHDQQFQNRFLTIISSDSEDGCQLRPPIPETFDSWLAALLCWQPLKYEEDVRNEPVGARPGPVVDRRVLTRNKTPAIGLSKSITSVKVGQMYVWIGPLPPGSAQHARRQDTTSTESHRTWILANCRMLDNSTFELSEQDTKTPLWSAKLSYLCRSSVCRIHDTVASRRLCLSINPKLGSLPLEAMPVEPIYLSLDSRAALEAWYTLFRSMTMPEVYQSGSSSMELGLAVTTDSSNGHHLCRFRVERSINVKITECTFVRPLQDTCYTEPSTTPPSRPSSAAPQVYIYADILLDGQVSARTTVKGCSKSAFWAQEFHILDVPPIVGQVQIVVKKSNADEREWTVSPLTSHDLTDNIHNTDKGMLEILSHDSVFGHLNIPLDALGEERVVEKWRPLLGRGDVPIGRMLVKCTLQETVVLMASEYQPLSDLLHNFDNSLTSQISQVLGGDLKQLSDILLDVFQASDSVPDWIISLIEEEIDGIFKEPPPVRMRFSGRIHSNDSYESAEQRELLVRDLSRSATMEASLLFRGNSLVTKALDAHMRRIGHDYLEKTLGQVLRDIVARDPECEVDPNKVKSPHQLERNWSNLINLIRIVWQSILPSASQCPPGMRQILKHVRSCAEDRYGSFIRTVKYTSVSGFLFLRFFCPAILNPTLFGLVDGQPSDRCRRTFTLVAKSLNALANMSRFGQKEPWMEPMNKFVTGAAQDFKDFIEKICTYNAIEDTFHEAQYTATLQTQSRLPATAKEGLPTLPYLLDASKSLATLVQLWMANVPSNLVETGIDEDMQHFHTLCTDIDQKTRSCGWQRTRSIRDSAQANEHGDPARERRHLAALKFSSEHDDADLTALPQTIPYRGPGLRRHDDRENASRPIQPSSSNGLEDHKLRKAQKSVTSRETLSHTSARST